VNKFEAETCAELSRSIVRYSDYYPFGFEMAGRADQSVNYRYGFNGKEKDSPGMGGGGSTYDYGFRIYNPSIAKFLSVDPLTKSYSWLTPYQFACNTPIQAIDLDGLEAASSISASSVIQPQIEALTNIPGNPGFRPTQTVTEYAISLGNDNYRILKSYTNLNTRGAAEIDAYNNAGGEIVTMNEADYESRFGDDGTYTYEPIASYRTGVGQNGQYDVSGISSTNTSLQQASVNESNARTSTNQPAAINGVYTPQNTSNNVPVPLGRSVTLQALYQTGNNLGNSIQVSENNNVIMSTSGCVITSTLTPLTPSNTQVTLNPGGSITVTQQPDVNPNSTDVWSVELLFNVTTSQQLGVMQSGWEYDNMGNPGYSGGYDPNTKQTSNASIDYQPTPYVTRTVPANPPSPANSTNNNNSSTQNNSSP
jgi:RHS repeat-associated protein